MDIAFSVGEEIKLRCIGSKAIHLTGYFINDDENTASYCNGYDSEELEAERDGESIASTSSSSSEEDESNDDDCEFGSSDEDEEFCHGHSSDDSFIVDDDVEEYITSSSSSSSDERDSEFSASSASDDEEDLDTEEEEELFRELNKRYSKRKNSINNKVILSDSDDMSDDEVDSDEFSSGDDVDVDDQESLTTSSSESLCDSDVEIDSLSDVSFESADYDNDNDLEEASCCATSSSEDDVDMTFESEDEYTSSESDITSSTDSDEEEDSDVEFNTSEEEAFAAELYKRVKKLQKRKHYESSSSSEEQEEEEILSDEAFAEGETQDSIMKKVKNDDAKEEQVIPEVVPIAVAVADDANIVEVGASAKEELAPVITPAPTPVNSPKKTVNNSSALEYKVLECSSKKSGIKSQKGRQVTLHSQAEGGAEVQTVLQSDSPFSKALLGMGVGEKRKIVLSEECISSPCALLKEFKNGDAKDITVCLTACQNVGKNISVTVSQPSKKAKKE